MGLNKVVQSGGSPIPPDTSNYSVYSSFNAGSTTNSLRGFNDISGDGHYTIVAAGSSAGSIKLLLGYMSTAWDVSTMVLGSQISAANGTLLSRVRGVNMIADPSATDFGKRFFVWGERGDCVECTLTQAWNLTTGSFSTALAGVASGFGYRPKDTKFLNGGLTMIQSCDTGTTNGLNEHTLTSAYDVSSAVLASPTSHRSFASMSTTIPFTSYITELCFVSAGKACFVMDKAGQVATYDTSASPYDISLLVEANITNFDSTTYADGTGTEEMTFFFDPIANPLAVGNFGIFYRNTSTDQWQTIQVA